MDIKKRIGPIFWLVRMGPDGKGVKYLAEKGPDGKFVIAEPKPFDPDMLKGEVLPEESREARIKREASELEKNIRIAEEARKAEQRLLNQAWADAPEGMEGGGYRKKRYRKRTLKLRRRPNHKTKARRRSRK